MNFIFVVNSILLGLGLAMDAFSVSLANGMRENRMKFGRMSAIALVYAFFQYAMPMIGWICVHTVVTYFSKFEVAIPWIALILLLYIGGKMIVDTLRNKGEDEDTPKLSIATLAVQGIATSIDALSVGFTIAEYNLVMALVCGAIIAAVTFLLCMMGLEIGKKFGTKLAGKAGLLGGTILIGIGIEIFIKGVFF